MLAIRTTVLSNGSEKTYPCQPAGSLRLQAFMLRRLAPFAADLWQHHELLWQFTRRNVESRHKGSHLGILWPLLNPLLMLGLYVLVFGYIFGGRFGVLPDESRVDYALGIFLSLTLFHFFSEILTTAPTVIVSNPNFVKKVVFPLEIMPAANVGGALFHLLVSLGLVLISVVCFGRGLHLNACWLPVILLPLVLLALGVGWFFSALGVFFRDINQIMQFLGMALLWSSAVFFSAQKYPAAWTYLRYNPVLLAIDLARNAVLWDIPLHLTHLLYLYAVSLAVCYVGHAFFKRTKPTFADVI